MLFIGNKFFSTEVIQYIENNKISNKNTLNIINYFDNNDYEKYGYKYPYLGSEKEFFNTISKVKNKVVDSEAKLFMS